MQVPIDGKNADKIGGGITALHDPQITKVGNILRKTKLDEIVGGDNADEMYEKYVLKKKTLLRIKYAHSVSFKTDAYILFKTI